MEKLCPFERKKKKTSDTPQFKTRIKEIYRESS